MRSLTTLSLLLAFLAPTTSRAEPAQAPATDPERYSLVYGPGPSQPWQSLVRSRIEVGGSENGTQFAGITRDVDLTYTSKTVATRVNGDVVEENELTRVEASSWQDGNHEAHDSSSDPEFDRGLIGIKLIGTRDKAGRVTDFEAKASGQAEGESINLEAAKSMASNALVFPDHPVALGESWDLEQASTAFPGLGHVRYTLRARLDRIETRGEVRRAMISVSASNPVWEALPSALAVNLDGMSATGIVEYDFAAAHIITQSVEATTRLSSPSEPGTLYQLSSRVLVRELMTQSWVTVPPWPEPVGALAPTAPASTAQPPEWTGCVENDASVGDEERISKCTAVIAAPNANSEPRAEAYYHRGLARLRLHQLEEGRKDLASSVEMTTLYPERLIMLAAVEIDLNRFDDALGHARQAANLDPANPAPWALIGASLLRLGRHGDALAACNKGLVLAGDNPAYAEVKGDLEQLCADLQGHASPNASGLNHSGN